MARILEDTSINHVEQSEGAIPEDESKAQTFQRLAPLRVNNALNKIRIVGNLANTANYEFTDAQVDRIEAALYEGVQQIMRQFRKEKKNNTFTL